MKKVNVVLVAATIAGTVLMTSCGGNSPAAQGKKAAKETCACDKMTDIEKSLACFEEVAKKYGKYDKDKEFNEAFDKASEECKK